MLDWETIDLGPLEEPALWDLLFAAQVQVNKIAHSIWSQSEKFKISTGYSSIKEMVDALSNEVPLRSKLNYFRRKVQALREQADCLTSQCACLTSQWPTTPDERSVGRLEVVDWRGGICKKRSDDGMSSVDFVAGVLYRSPLNGLLHSRMIQPPFHSS